MRNHQTKPTLADVAVTIEGAGQSLLAYLSGRFGEDADGFPVPGDDDLHRELRKLALLLAATDSKVSNAVARLDETDPQARQTWHSTQREVLCCTGEESDAVIAAAYRDGLR